MKRIAAAAFLVPLTAAWNAGNVGAIVAPLADEYSISLGAVGLASGTFFFGGMAYGLGESVLPDRPVGGLGLLLTGANAFPIAAIPLVGAALASDDSAAAFLPLAVLVLAAGILNYRGAKRLERRRTG